MTLVCPNLPSKKVALCAAANTEETVAALNNYEIEVISPVINKELDSEISFHTDMLICHAGENLVFAEPGQTELSERLKEAGYEVRISEPLGNKYPDDVKLNFAVSKDFILGNYAFADKNLLDYFNKCGKKLINVKQGYAKCSLCFVTENAFITEDEAIFTALKDEGKDVLLISKGDVYLSEKHYGFLGGATGKISKTALAVTGSLRYHSDRDIILTFIKKHGVELIELSAGRIKDIGGIIPLTEE